jgi:hypothetical protein
MSHRDKVFKMEVKAWGYEVRGLGIEPLLQRTNQGARPAPAQTAAAFADLGARHRSVRRARGPWQGHGPGSADENRGADTARTRACEERKMTHEKVARLQGGVRR